MRDGELFATVDRIVSRLEQENRDLCAARSALEPYVAHKAECASNYCQTCPWHRTNTHVHPSSHAFDAQDCNCGLAQLLGEHAETCSSHTYSAKQPDGYPCDCDAALPTEAVDQKERIAELEAQVRNEMEFSHRMERERDALTAQLSALLATNPPGEQEEVRGG